MKLDDDKRKLFLFVACNVMMMGFLMVGFGAFFIYFN
jgi:hypothetical protein